MQEVLKQNEELKKVITTYYKKYQNYKKRYDMCNKRLNNSDKKNIELKNENNKLKEKIKIYQKNKEDYDSKDFILTLQQTLNNQEKKIYDLKKEIKILNKKSDYKKVLKSIHQIILNEIESESDYEEESN